MTCSKCGAQNPQELIQCEKCGELLLDVFSETGVDLRGSGTGEASKTARSPVEAATEFMTREQSIGSVGASGRGSASSGVSLPSGQTRDLTPSTLLGNRYEILDLLGEGGMGIVYKARDLELDKVIALKTIRAAKENDEITRRFKQELLLSRKVTHKNVVRIHDLSEAEGIKFFTMEFIDGESLKQIIRSRGKIAVEEAISLAKQILSALEEAHRQGVIHRDMKPQNVMVDAQGTAYVMDFGIARTTDMTGMTATGAVIGTPDYMSPEQVRGEKAEQQSDLFSFGVILYEMLTGELPYNAESAISKVVMRLTQKPRAPREINLDIPRYMENVVLKCMEVDTALRYQTSTEILEDIDRGHVDRSLTLRVQRAVARRRGLLATAGLVAATAGIATYLATRGPVETVAKDDTQVPSTTVAILPFTNTSGSTEMEWMRTGLAEMLVTDIGQSRYVRPVPVERVLFVLRELGVAEQTRFDEAALESISKKASAQTLLYGSFLESGGKLRLTLTLRRAGSGVPLPIQVEAGSSEVFSIVDRITRAVKERLDLSPNQLKGDNDRPIAQVSPASLEALRAYQAGLAQLNQGANKEAIPLFKEATNKDPEFAMAYAKLAEAHLALAEHDDAEVAIERAKTLAEQTKQRLPLAEYYQIHATAATVDGEHNKAVESFQELAKLYPSDPDVLLGLGDAYKKLGKLPDAIDAYRRALKIAPGYGAAFLALGEVLVMSGDNDEAVEPLEEALQTNQFEKNPEALGKAHSILGVAFKETGKLDKALEHLDASLQIRLKISDRRGQAATYLNQGGVYVKMGKMAKGFEAYNKALRINRDMGNPEQVSKTLNNLGGARKDSGNLDLALASFRESLQIEMEREDHLNMANRLDQIADIYRLKGQYEDAIIYLEQAKAHLAETEEKREKAINFEFIGLVRKVQGLYKDAIEAFLAAAPLYQEIGLETGVAEMQKYLGIIYHRQGRYADAYKAFQQSVAAFSKTADPEHDIAEVRAPFSMLLLALGHFDEAESEIAQAEHATLGHGGHGAGPAAQVLLAKAAAHAERGRAKEAAQTYEEASAKANASGQRELILESRLELGRFYLAHGKLTEAEPHLVRARKDAAKSRLRAIEAEAAAALAQLYLARGNAEAARKAALDSIDFAQKLEGRPILYRTYSVLGEALDKLGRSEEGLDAFQKGAATLEWMRGGLLPEHVESFMARQDIQAFLKKTVAALEKRGRLTEAEPLKKWLRAKRVSSTGA